ncbi:rCG40912 [Rattus norvegicus]|uniref:RCG40912 n=1 Tax=Rattus norvegicus TaxID=10116 RepID=A6KL26_RAT|nr:rCG40912 [Rattus norvegicus]
MVSGGQKTSMHGPFSVRPGGTEQEPEELTLIRKLRQRTGVAVTRTGHRCFC